MSESDSNLSSDESRTGVNSGDSSSSSESGDLTCFLCLIGISSEKKLSLLKICRYLKLNPEEVSQQFVRKNETDDFSVNLCQQCLSICSKLSDLCSEWELLQKKINKNLKTFSGILDNSKDDHFQTSGPTDDWRFLDDGAKAESFLKHLREQLKKTCHQKLKSTSPQVKFPQESERDTFIPVRLVPAFFDDPPETNFYVPENSPDAGVDQISNDNTNNLPGTRSRISKLWECPQCPSKFKHKCNLQLHLSQKHNVNPAIKCFSCNFTFSQQSEFQNHSYLPDCPRSRIAKPEPAKKTERKCHLCNPPRIFQNLSSFQRHKVDHHIEAVFATSRQKYHSTEYFKLYCEHAIKTEMLSNGQNSQCPHCPSSFMDDASFRHHLVLTHQEILAGKIVALKKNSSMAEIKEWSSGQKLTFKCPKCRNIFASEHGMERHRRRFCSGKRGSKSSSTKIVGKTKICTACTPHLPVSHSHFRRHQIMSHLETFFMSSKLPELSQADFKIYCDHVIKLEVESCLKESNSEFRCAHCSDRLSKQCFLYTHLFSAHQEILAEKIANLQETTDVEEIKINETEEKHDGLEAGPVTCTLCNPHRTVTSFNFQRHQSLHHLDTFFVTVKLPDVSQTDFKIYCDHVIQVEVSSSEKIQLKNSEVLKCGHCSTRYKNPNTLYQHIFSAHKEILAEKILKIQQSTKIEEIKKATLPGNYFGWSKRCTCDICGRPCKNKLALNAHTIFAHGKGRYRKKRKAGSTKEEVEEERVDEEEVVTKVELPDWQNDTDEEGEDEEGMMLKEDAADMEMEVSESEDPLQI